MTGEKNVLSIRFGDYNQTGLYLLFENRSRLALTRENVENTAKEYWADPSKICPDVKQAVNFQRCPICPLRDRNDFCDALRPVLPWLNIVDNYRSFDPVTAIYKADEQTLLHISDTTMQEALNYISFLSLTKYCQVGAKYRKFYFGMMPLITGVEFMSRVYLNMFWILNGDEEELKRVISEFNKDITITARNQVERLNLICKNDAFLNSFVNAQTLIQLLEIDKDTLLQKSYDYFQQT